MSRIISLEQFICENVCIAKSIPRLKSGQVFIVQVDSIVIKSAKPYLVTPGAIVHGHYGEIFYKKDMLVKFQNAMTCAKEITIEMKIEPKFCEKGVICINKR
ncbi:hypothetical protein Gotur_004487, partial [Gossypium turneri]